LMLCPYFSILHMILIALKVLAAFLVTGLASIGAMYWAYFHDCLDKDSITNLDKAVLAWVHNFPLFHNASEKEEITRTNLASEVLQQFVLTLSDQQLVTGFAILIASFALRCSISVLNFQIASSLAWFSSVTHLATLAILRHYFHEHVWMLRIRLACMIAVLIMLLATIYTAIDYWDLVLPVQCSYANIADGSPGSFGFSAQMLAGTWVTAWLQTYLFLVYGNRIVDLMSKERIGVINLVTWLNKLLRTWQKLENKGSDLKFYEKAAIKAADENQQHRFLCQLALMYVLFQELTKSFF
jgi:ABC-type multidrug transport system fused ATPase/permease subunit